MQEHMLKHTGGTPLYSCPHCPKTFNSRANSYTHNKRMHPKEWENRKNKKLIKTESEISS